MIAVTTTENKTQKQFAAKFKSHFSTLNCKCAPVVKVEKKGEKQARFRLPETDITHVFNNEAMLAFSYAIEDLAGEKREGEIISTFQKFDNFLPQKKRYVSLAKDLDAVRVWGTGSIPQRCGKIDFIPILDPRVKKYWMVLYTSQEDCVILLCRQLNRATSFEKKIFTGFYSFNPFLVNSIKRNFNLMTCGLERIGKKWEKQLAIPSLPLSKVEELFRDQE